MSYPTLMTDPIAIRDFVVAGNSHFTLKSQTTGQRFTYRVRAPDNEKKPQRLFVSVLTGSDNQSEYSYLGHMHIDSDYFYVHGSKSRISPEAPSAKGFKWFWSWVRKCEMPMNLEFWHEGRCARCHRLLTDPLSIQRGFGPECYSVSSNRPTFLATGA